MFELDALIFHCFENRNAHIATGEVVVCAVRDGVFIPHKVHTDEAGDHNQNRNAHPEKHRTVKRDVTCDGVVDYGLAFGCDCRRDVQSEHYESAHNARHEVRNVCRTAEFVVDGPVPNRVGVSVEKHSAFHFARAFLDGGNAVSRLFGEALVNEFFVKTELNEQNRKSQARKHRSENGKEEEQHHTRKHEGYREVNPTEKRVGVFGERFNVGPFATAVVFEVVRHIFARHFFTLAAGIALWHIVANMRDFVAHKLCALRLVVDKLLKFSHKLPPRIR